MKIKSISVQSFRRFSDLTIQDLSSEAKLVVMVGPNGSGKSALFDAFNMWQLIRGFHNYGGGDIEYYQRKGFPLHDWSAMHQNISIDFHQELPADPQTLKKTFYIRTAYRNEPDFVTNSISRLGPEEDRKRVSRLIDNDASVSANYQSIAGITLDGLFKGEYDELNGREIVDLIIGQVRNSMRRIFEDLVLRGPGDPLGEGTFLFEKGQSIDFQYKNLSGGEKSAFDLLLDFILKRNAYRDTIFCIDEPEAHMNTRLQASLLRELVALLPDDCQLWIATHSIGMMREARDIQKANPSCVAFLDFFDRDFDRSVVLTPVAVDRQFWKKTLDVALGDVAELVAPQQVVLCEGRPAALQDQGKAEFDAKCYQTIFDQEYPDTAFISVGNDKEVQRDPVKLGPTIEALVSGTKVIRVIDRDDRSPQEISELKGIGVRVLSARHLEVYLMEDEILKKLCDSRGQADLLLDILIAKQQALNSGIARKLPPDDVKSASGVIYVQIKKLLGSTQVGNTAHAFMRDTLAPLVTSETTTYAALKRDIFGE